jgi:hypothetical protein
MASKYMARSVNNINFKSLIALLFLTLLLVIMQLSWSGLSVGRAKAGDAFPDSTLSSTTPTGRHSPLPLPKVQLMRTFMVDSTKPADLTHPAAGSSTSLVVSRAIVVDKEISWPHPSRLFMRISLIENAPRRVSFLLTLQPTGPKR